MTKGAAARWKEPLISQGCQPGTVNAMLLGLNRLLGFPGRRDCRVTALRIQRQLFREDSRERLALLMEAICAAGIRASGVQSLTVEAVQRGRAEMKALCEASERAPPGITPTIRAIVRLVPLLKRHGTHKGTKALESCLHKRCGMMGRTARKKGVP